MTIHVRINGKFGSYSLLDSETNERLSAEELEMTETEYEELIRESYAQGTAEGHIRLATGRRVYAMQV